jgi:hypothetical protein
MCINGYQGNPRAGTPSDCKPVRPQEIENKECNPVGSVAGSEYASGCRCKVIIFSIKKKYKFFKNLKFLFSASSCW